MNAKPKKGAASAAAPGPKKRRARGSGSLFFRAGAGWFARYAVTKDGDTRRVAKKLDTFDRVVARRKLDRLVAIGREPTTADIKRHDTFLEATTRAIARQRAAGLGTWRDRQRRLEMHALTEIGTDTVDVIGRARLKEVIEAAAAKGLSHQTLQHLSKDISSVFKDLVEDGVLKENPASPALPIPASAPVDERPRLLLTDDEFTIFMNCTEIEFELRLMALCSRVLGGARTSDLHAWQWSHIDWTDRTAHVPRPKTKRKGAREVPTVYAMPDDLVPILEAWWKGQGSPTAGYVFPVLKGKRKGGSRKKSSYAKALRAGVWAAKIYRPLPGFNPTHPSKERCALQVDTEVSRALDFHSFRRQYATELARSGANLQTAMALAGHKSPQTALRYVKLSQTLATPAGALPDLKALSVAYVPRKPRSDKKPK